ncbi:MAG: hypothetical protein ACI9LO_000341 [Planctomycetota bacterium]|jgi:hypothetical protein
MKSFVGKLHKMHVELENPVRYRLELSGETIDLNEWIGRQVTIEYLQRIECVHCGRTTKKSFSQGYCYPCFIKLAQCDLCIMSPERCHFHLGTCREPEWGELHCMKPHIVYFSNTSGVKVGVTRESQIPTRWIDQGALQAMPVLRVSKRYHAGLIEVAFKQFMNDKTNWRNMLKNEVAEVDLFDVYQQFWPQVKAGLAQFLIDDIEEMASPESAIELNFPANAYPTKVTSFNLEKLALATGTLDAIKGQYLIFDSGVINIRKYAGYQVSLSVDEPV